MVKNKNKRRYTNQSEINKLFNNNFDPNVDNLDNIVLYGYYDLSNTEKIAYLIINNLYRDNTKITTKLLMNLMRVSKKTVYKCINKLESINLIEKVGEEVNPLLPNPEDNSFREAMSLI